MSVSDFAQATGSNIPAEQSEAQPPAILQVLPALVAGGVERGVVDVTAALVRAGWRALVVSQGGRMVRDVQRAGGTHFTLPIATRNPLLTRRNAALLTGLIQDNAVDLVHARSRAPAWSAMRAARATGVPFVTTFHGTYGSNNAFKRRYNSVMTKGDKVIAISDFVNQHIRDGYKVDPEKLVTIHRGVDTTQFDPAAVTAARIIQKSQAWRLPDGVPVIMLPGRITRWKGHQILIEALYRLPHRDFICVFVGSAKRRATYRDDLDKMVAERSLQSVVSFVDHEMDMPAAYMLADVVVSASTDPEAFGRVTAEAQAMGRLVVATDHGGSRETVVPGETGWLVRPGDPAELATAITEALELNAASRHAMAQRARTRIREKFDVTRMCNATLGVYSEMLGRAWNK
ncbi:MAG: glycosyltransferase family 4 protein [Alphaproteobacteria bacterium]|jgi:glycosyltransferase involved in cell wall biosynthesis|nr:glycosyltransferase family 4 protein [Alphaproteobacteria bacterium]